MSGWVVVGISGVTNGGKSTLTKRLKENLPCRVAVINQDDYFYPEDSEHHVPSPGGLSHHNWDVLTSLNMDKMVADVLAVVNSEPECLKGAATIDSLADGSPISGKDVNDVTYKPILLLDGFLLYDHKVIMNTCNLRYFFTLGREECRQRRYMRAYDPPDPEGYFDACVWPMYEAYHARTRHLPDITFLDGTADPYHSVCQEVLGLARVSPDGLNATDNVL